MQNIVFISADQLRADALGFENVFPVKTPHIDALAAQGTVFDNAYVAVPLCVPSRASIMTGRHAYQHGVYYNDQGWSDDLDTVASNLAANGYRTVEFGKTHFQPPGKHYGFDKVVHEGDHRDHLASLGLLEKPPHPLKTWEEQVARTYRTEPTTVPLEHYEPVYHTTNAIAELRRMAEQRDCTGPCHEPFFMWVSYLQPHVPCVPPEPYFSMYSPDELPEPMRRPGEVENFPQPLKDFYAKWTWMNDEHMRQMRAQYLGDITLVDEQVGRLLATLDELHLADNTLIVFFADHGDHMGDHYLQQKGSFYESSARVPLILRGPGVPTGRRIDANVSLVDLLPTAVAYADLYQPPHYDAEGNRLYHHQPPAWSRSLLDTIERADDAEVKDRCIVVESAIHGQSIMVKQGDRKYCWYPQTDELLVFDLVDDPDELDPTRPTMESLPEAVQATFAHVTGATDQLASRSYFFNEKIRPMFS